MNGYFAVLFILDVLIGAMFLMIGVTSCMSKKEEVEADGNVISFKKAA